VLVAPSSAPPPAPAPARAATLPADFQESIAFSGLTNPTVVRFASDGRVFVAEKSGLIKVFDSLSDTTATTFADLRTNVYNFWDRGLLGLALHPNFPATPYVYALYTYDHVLGSPALPPKWGTPGATTDPCPTPPGPTSDGCVVSGRLSRLQASGNTMTGSEQVLIEDWCQQYPSHSIGAIEFGPDGALYVSGGDGSSFTFVDYGADGDPVNPCGDPGGTNPQPPTAEGGSLRSQDLRTAGDPVTLDGAILRVDPSTGAGAAGNPFAGNADQNARRIIAYGLRNPFRFAFRPPTSELWVGDVGWTAWEEINRIPNPTDAVVENFGWPCYEGSARQSGYDSANLNICENLYSTANAVTNPFFRYHHNDEVVTGESCPTGSSSISGVSFEFSPTGGSYPTAYQRALFFADYSRDCIWVMKKDANGVPAPGLIEPFVAAAANPVNLEFGPGGDLFYVDFDGGTIRRVRYVPPDPSPSCPTGEYAAQYYSNMTLGGTSTISRCEGSVNYDWANGGPGEGVPNDHFSVRWTGQFEFGGGETTFTVTADDGIRLWVDGQLLIDKWIDQPASTYTATRTVTAGTHHVKVEYYENTGAAEARVSWSTAAPPATCPTGQYLARYYGNIGLADPALLTRCEAAIDYTWGTGGPGGAVPTDNFSARWVGLFNFPGGETTFTVTSDDGMRLWLDGSILIDAWVDQAATTYAATRTVTAGTHEVRVEYYEKGIEAVARVAWTTSGPNSPPVPTIATPTSAMKWKVGDTIGFSGSAADAEQGTLPASALTWTLLIQHCPANCHTHTVQTWPGVAGGTFTAPDHEYPSHLELRLTATDSGGATGTATVELDPLTVQLDFVSSPGGLQLAVNAVSSATPFTRTVIVASTNSLSAPSPQMSGGTTYEFASWSDGGQQTHSIVAPASAGSFTATYRIAPPRNTALPTISGQAREGRPLTVSDGTWSGSAPMSFSYRWLRCSSSGDGCIAISGAVARTYVLTSADVGSRLRAVVTATNPGGSSSATSGASAVVKRAH
jgi:glucose/arabinose dehydrogenase